MTDQIGAIVDQVSQISNDNVLITTYTEDKHKKIKEVFLEKNGFVPLNVSIKTWHSTVLQYAVWPYSSLFCDKEIKGISAQESSSSKYISESNVEEHYLDYKRKIYPDKISKFACRCNMESKGKLINELSRIWPYIFVCDLETLMRNDDDFDFYYLLVASKIDVRVICDHKKKMSRTNAYTQRENQKPLNRFISHNREPTKQSINDFACPPWATRALLQHVFFAVRLDPLVDMMSCLEPACGRGYMSRALSERFGQVDSFDIKNYGFGKIRNFLTDSYHMASYDWVITNPPFSHAQEFAERALTVAKYGVAILARTSFVESNKRYKNLFQDNPPTYIAQFVERLPIIKQGKKSKIQENAAHVYAWFIWDMQKCLEYQIQKKERITQVIWIPPCRHLWEKPDDYSRFVRREVK